MMRMLRVALVASMLASSGWARADDAYSEPVTAPPTDAKPARDSVKPRPVPDYDGRGSPHTNAGDVALWVPRIAASPFYLTNEFLLRRPLGAIVIYSEQNRLPQALADAFTFDKDHKVGIIPTAFIDFGFLPSVGLYFFWDDAFTKKNDVRLRAATWGPDWLAFGATDRYALDDHTKLILRGSWTRRQDWLFYGVGPRSHAVDETRYGSTTLDVNATLEHDLSRYVRFHSTLGVRDNRFRNAACCGDATLLDAVNDGRYPVPPGFFEGYTIAYDSLTLTADSRPVKPLPQNGFRLELEGQPAFDLKQSPGASWIRYGGTVGGFLDLTGHNRVLSLSVTMLFADPITGGPIPFTEQVMLGGDRYMRGFLWRRLVDRSAFVATLQYEWPVWVWLDGTLQVSTGNVFGPGLAGIDPNLFRLSSGMGVRTSNSPESQIEALVGFGTETFADHATVSSFRVFVGATHGF